jgi:hypothetical protein
LIIDWLKNHAGLLLIADYASLHELHEIVHDVNERSPSILQEDGPSFLGLAYDACKAYERQRKILRPPDGHEGIGVCYGVDIALASTPRAAAYAARSPGYLDHSRRYQAITYAREGVIEAGLREDFGAQGQTIVDHCYGSTPPQISSETGQPGRSVLLSGPKLTANAVALRCC